MVFEVSSVAQFICPPAEEGQFQPESRGPLDKKLSFEPR